MLSLQSLNLIEESFVFSNCWGHRSYCLDFSWSHVRSWWVVSSSYCYVGKIQLFQPITATENNSVFCIFSCLAKYDCFNRLQIISQFLVFSVAWYNTIVSTNYCDRPYLSFQYFDLPGTIWLFQLITLTDPISGFWCCMCIPLCMDSLKVTPNSC